MVVGITGLDAARQATLRRFSERHAVLVAPNMSLAVNLLFGLAGRAAAALPADYDVEILEAHHRGKADAPSGTALQARRDRRRRARGNAGRAGGLRRVGNTGGRATGAIGFASLRAGDIVGQHQVLFAGHRRDARVRAPDHRSHDVRLRRAGGRPLDNRPPAGALRDVPTYSESDVESPLRSRPP